LADADSTRGKAEYSELGGREPAAAGDLVTGVLGVDYQQGLSLKSACEVGSVGLRVDDVP
jgi:hypothetical protein